MEGQPNGEELILPKTSNDVRKRKPDNVKHLHAPNDVTFRLGNMTFQSRKALLAKSSPVFKAMFFGPLADRRDIVEIKDIDSTGFRNLLRFACTGQVVLKGTTDTLATAFAADRYNVPKLFILCIKKVTSSISVSNIWMVYEAAVLLENNRIRKVCKNFMIQHANTLLKTDQFLHCSTVLLTFLVDDLVFSVTPETLVPALVAWTRRRKCFINFVLKTFKSYLDSVGIKSEVFQSYVHAYESKVLTDKEFEAISLDVQMKRARKIAQSERFQILFLMF